jgi:pimeloyl-ACP methyl ester carboxylesterase
MNVPPFEVFGQIGSRYEQIKSSFYFWFFQMRIAGAVVAADDLAFIDGLWRDWSPGYDAAVDLEHVKECLRQPKNLSAAMGYYHALFNPDTYGSDAFAAEQLTAWGNALTQPTLYMHGTADGCLRLDEETQRGVLELLSPGSESLRIPDAGHFMMVQRPKEVNDRILRFIGSPKEPTVPG